MIFNNEKEYLKINSYQRKYLSEIKKLIPEDPFYPWFNRVVFNLEGAFACGWTDKNEVLMICNDGYVIINPDNGGIIDENYKTNPYDSMSRDNLEFKIKKTNINVKIFGLYGGDGNMVHSEGWELRTIYPSWPNSIVAMEKPSTSDKNLKIWENTRLISLNSIEYGNLKCGFSLNEKYFLIFGINNGVEIFQKDTN